MKQLKWISLGSLLLFTAQGFAQDKDMQPTVQRLNGEVKAEPVGSERAADEIKQALIARMRTEWLSSATTTKTTSSATSKTSGFRIQRMDLTFANQLADKIAINIRVAPVQNNGVYAAQSTSSGFPVSNLIEHAWLAYNLGAIELRLGKLDMVAGSVEYMENSPFDTYLTSYFNNASNTIIPARGVGVSTFFKIAGQRFELQITNGLPTDDTDINGNYVYGTKGGVITGLAYHGDLGAVKPSLSISKVMYAEPSHDSSNDGTTDLHSNSGRTLVGLGAASKIAETLIEAEYDMGVIDPFQVQTGAVKTAVGNRQTVDSVILSARYSLGAITPIAKVTLERHKKGSLGNVGDIAQSGISLAAEYAVAKNARFHLAYNKITRTTTKGGGTVDRKDDTNEVICGAAVTI